MTKQNNVTAITVPTAQLMPTAVTPNYAMADLCQMAQAFAYSRMFGVKDEHQALSLLMIAQANGQHPAKAMQDYDVIHGRPAKKAEAMHRDFLAAGGKVTWLRLDDECAEATFSHPDGGEATISWDDARVKKAGLTGNHAKYPRQMKRARVISEGVKTIYPAATSGMYVSEEVCDFDDRPMRDVTPPAADNALEPAEGIAVYDAAGCAAKQGKEAFRAFWRTLGKSERDALKPHIDELQGLAEIADTQTAEFREDFGIEGAPEVARDELAIPAFLDRRGNGETVNPEAGEVSDGDAASVGA